MAGGCTLQVESCKLGKTTKLPPKFQPRMKAGYVGAKSWRNRRKFCFGASPITPYLEAELK
jgi:hypothetical protein